MLTMNPADVRAALSEHMLVDGLDLVFDLEKSQGSYLYDSTSGRRFLDFFSFFATQPVGVNHPRMREPEFMKKMAGVAIHNPSNSDIYTVEMAEFVETFARVAIPAELSHLFLVAGGSVAVENALKTAFDWKVRKNFARGIERERGHKVLHFREAFHGRTGYTLSMTNTADIRKIKYFPKFDWPRIVNPKLRFPVESHLAEVLDAEREAVAQIEQALVDNRDDIAALVIEPIQGEGGDNHFRAEFFQKLRELADEHEFLFIVDEVQTGVGLTGKMWAYQHFGFTPDILAFGKKTQVCGILVGSRVDEVENNVFAESARINSTWGGNLVDMVRFARYLEIIDEERLVDNAREVGEYLLGEIEKIQDERAGQVSNTRGRGLMCAFDLPDTETRDRFRALAFEQGMIVLGCGRQSIRFRPTLSASRDDVDRGMEIVRRILSKLA
ncbi:MAG TPA: L-lysine 6-transaminase [Vicinamibacteria bacterium]|nr:L-lysine 6-transaminase [Vicinamibacteria bacterium]